MVIDHVASCQSCKSELANLLKISQMIKATYAPSLSVDFSRGIMRRIVVGAGASSKKVLVLDCLSKRRYAFVSAALLAGVFGAFLYFHSVSEDLKEAEKRLEVYAVEHALYYEGKVPVEPQIISVNFEKR